MSPRAADSGSAQVSTVWQAAHEPLVLTHRWGADTVVYVRERASTHWLNADAATVFLALRSAGEPLAAAKLAATLNSAAADDGELHAVLMQLAALGLAEALPSPP